MSKLNVLFVCNTLECGGAEKHLVTLLNTLSTDLFSLHLTYLKPVETLLPTIKTERLSGIFCCNVRNKLCLTTTKSIAHYIDHNAIDIVVCVNTYPMLYAFAAKALTRKTFKVVDLFHSSKQLLFKQKAQMLFYRPFFKMCDKVIFVSNTQRDYWKTTGLSTEKSEVIYNGVDTEYFRPVPHVALPKIFTVGICAGLRPEKAHMDMLVAIFELKKLGVSVNCVFIGDGPERAKLQQAIHSFGLQSSVRITGFKEDVRDEIAACNVMALVSHTEAFSMAVLEAMAMAKPLILSQVGGASEQIRHGLEGLVFTSGDIAGLVYALRMLERSDQLITMGASARKRVCELFSQESMIRTYEKSFLELGRAMVSEDNYLVLAN